MRSIIFRSLTALTVLLAVVTTTMAQNTGFDPKRMNTSVAACKDFFQYANGTWLETTEIPAAYSNWGSFNILAENNRDLLKEVLEKAAGNSGAQGSEGRLIGDFYSACMDEAAIERTGIEPLRPHLREIERISNLRDLHRQIAVMHNMGIPVLFGFGPGPDLKNSSLVIANAGQGGLSLPNRDYYTKSDEKSQETRDRFRQHIANMFRLLGDSELRAWSNAATVMRIQTRLANVAKPPVEMRNPENRYHKISLTEARQIAPNLDWELYMNTRGIPAVTELNIGQPAFFKEVNQMLSEIPLSSWKVYLRWMLVNSAAPYLPKAFVDENFDFYSRYLSGTQEQQPRWRRCIMATDSALGEALGQEFVKIAFTPEAKKRMDEMIDNLFAAMRERLTKLDWMSDATKQEALIKLSTFKRKIGYPDVLRGYQGLQIDRQSYLGNALRSGQFEIKRNLQDIGKPVDRTRWGMSPPTVNAYYSSLFNEIVFPAGILQPPFFNFTADDAINYGAIGGVIGHEITHGFDDQGSKFDAEGNFKMWWTEEDR